MKNENGEAEAWNVMLYSQLNLRHCSFNYKNYKNTLNAKSTFLKTPLVKAPGVSKNLY